MKRICLYIALFILSAFAFNGLRDGIGYISENGISVKFDSEDFISADDMADYGYAIIASSVTVPNSFESVTDSHSQNILAALSVATLLLCSACTVYQMHIRALCLRHLHRLIFPFHSFW